MTRLVLRVAPHRLVVSARREGLDLVHLTDLVAGRSSDRLPVVAPIAGTPLYEIQSGRHQFVAALISGAPTLLVEVVPPENAAGPPPRRAEGQRVSWWRAVRPWAARRPAKRPPPPA